MSPLCHIAMIDKRDTHHSLGAVDAYTARQYTPPKVAFNRLSATGRPLKSPVNEQPKLTLAASDLAPKSLEISNGEKTFGSVFMVMQFDPVSLLTMLWPSGPFETTEHSGKILGAAC